jgi:hypothetical protein
VIGLAAQVTLPSWVSPSQSNVSLSIFGGNLNYSRILNPPATLTWATLTDKPTYLNDTQSNVSLSNCGWNLSYSRIVDPPAQVTLPFWFSSSQYSILLSGFGGQVNWNSQISNRPTFNWSTLTDEQSNVTLSNFGGDLPSSRVTGLFLDTIPGYIDSSRVSNLPSVPIWLNFETQNQVQLS